MRGRPEFLGTTNDPTCGHQAKDSDSPCGAAASWHLVFTNRPPIEAGLACDDHAIICIREVEVFFIHRVARACLAPSPPAMFMPHLNRCIFPEETAAASHHVTESVGV